MTNEINVEIGRLHPSLRYEIAQVDETAPYSINDVKNAFKNICETNKKRKFVNKDEENEFDIIDRVYGLYHISLEKVTDNETRVKYYMKVEGRNSFLITGIFITRTIKKGMIKLMEDLLIELKNKK